MKLMLLFSPAWVRFFFFSDSKTICIEILHSIYILINSMPDNPVIYICPQTSPMKYCYASHSTPGKKVKD